MVGFWLQSIALSWLVYRLTGSAVMLGLVAFVTSIPMLVLAPFAGLISDRVDRRSMVLLTQSAQMLQAFVLAGLTLGDWVEPWQIVALALLQGVANTFDGPARHSLLTVMVGGKSDLPNAIALNSLIMNLGRFIGPVVAGLLLAWIGEGWCFLLNGISYLGVMVSLAKLPTSRAAAGATPGDWRSQLREGFAWIWNSLPARMLMLNLIALSFSAPNYQTLMPIFAREVFHGDSRIQGLLITFAGAGALAGTLMLAARTSTVGLPRVINIGSFMAGTGLCVFSLTSWLPLAALGLSAVGFGVIVTGAGTNTILQGLVEERLRGRIISLYMMGFLGVMPVGGFVLGLLADRFGPQASLGSFGLIGLASAALLWRRQPAIREGLAAARERAAKAGH